MKLTKIIFSVIAFLCLTNLYAQVVVKGTVTDQETNLPISGASVTVPNASIGTSTDDKGAFEISVPEGTTILTVTTLGYDRKEVTLKDLNSILTIQLTPSVLLLNEVVVEGFQSDKKLLQNTSTIGVLTEKDFERNNNVFLQNTLNTIPGVRMNMRSVASQSNILIRGIGTYSRFNIRGIKMYMNGIPLSDADGTTSIDDIDNTVIGRAEVIKGPASSIYGATLGGVVLFQTQKAPYNTRSVNQSVTVGSFGLVRTNTGISIGTNKVNLLLNYGHQQLDGYRKHSESNKDFVTVAGDFYISPKQTVNVLFNYTNVDDNYAGELDNAAVTKDPEQANANYIKKDVGLSLKQTRLGIGHTYHFNSKFSNTTSVFTSAVNSVSPVEPSIGTANKNKYGARTVFSYAQPIGSLKTRYHLGSEFIYNDNLSKKYSWTKTTFLDSSIIGDNEVRASQFNVFAQAEVDITKATTITAGASYNLVNYQIIDRFNNHNGKVNLSGSRNFTPVITPRVAVVHTFNEKVAVFANVSAGFSPPTSDQISYSNTGIINTNLKPEKNINYEIGTRGNLFKNKLTYGLSGFFMDLRNQLVQQTQSGATFFTNAAKSRNKGIELNLSYVLVNDSIGFLKLVRPFVAYTYNDFKFQDYTKGGVDLSGNKVTGTFPNIVSAGIDIQFKYGIYINGTYFYNDRMPILDNNSLFYKSYHLFNARAGIRGLLFKHLQYDLFGGIDNVSGLNYSASLALNNNSPTYYNPAYPRNYYGGLSLKYLF